MSGKDLSRMTAEELRAWLGDAALNWLAHDGLWFRAVEEAFGLERAIELDKKAWEAFTVIEAKRIMKRLKIPAGGGLSALARALEARLYALVNDYEVSGPEAGRLVFRMKSCRVQDARRKQGLAEFPCREVGLVEYGGFARIIDPRVQTRCLHCPPGARPAESWCAWEFVLGDAD